MRRLRFRQGEVTVGLSFGDVRRALKREHLSGVSCRQPHQDDWRVGD